MKANIAFAAPSLIRTKDVKTYLKLPPKSILIPSRTRESFASYPKYQQTVENFLNFQFLPCFVKPPKDIGTKEEIKLNRLKSITRQLEGFYQGLNVRL